MEKYFDSTDEFLISKIKEIGIQKIINNAMNPSKEMDTITYTDDEVKQFIVETLFVAGSMTDVFDESNPIDVFGKRITRLFLEMVGLAKKDERGNWIFAKI